MHYLITGGAGFIGSHLAETLLTTGDHVTILDDLSTGTMHNIAHIQSHPHFSCCIGSIMDQQVLAPLVAQCDVIIHLAAAVGVLLVVDSPVKTIETNVRGTELVLQCANEHHKRVLVASSSEVYGKSNKIPFHEDDDLVLGASTKGRWSYACSKALDEFLAIAYWREKGLPTTIMRFFNTVGPRQVGRYGMVIPRFVKQALDNTPITVYGDGSQSRCFTHVKDVVRAVYQLSRSEAAIGEIFNIGTNEEITIKELATRIQSHVGSSSPIHYIPYSQAYAEGFEDMMRRVPDISKITRLIGYQPQHNLDKILTDVIADMSGPNAARL